MCIDRIALSATAALVAITIVTLIGTVFEYGYF